MKAKTFFYSQLFQSIDFIEYTRNFLFNDTEYLRQFYTYLNIGSNDVICDLGCGTGYMDFMLNRKFSETEIFGLDKDAKYLQYAKKRNTIEKIDKVHFINCDLNYPFPFDNNFFDLVFSFGAMHMVKNYNKTLQESIRILKPNGRIVIFLPIDECPQPEAEMNIIPFASEILTMEKNLFDNYYKHISKYIERNHGLIWSEAPKALLNNSFKNIQIHGMFTPFNPENHEEKYLNYLELMSRIEKSRAMFIYKHFNKNKMIFDLIKMYDKKYRWLSNEFTENRNYFIWGGAPLLIISGKK